MAPKISIVIPIYNSEKFINRTIESILCQSMQDFELIISDDGSTDRSLQIVNQYAAKDSRIRVVANEHYGNIAKVLNKIKGDLLKKNKYKRKHPEIPRCFLFLGYSLTSTNLY